MSLLSKNAFGLDISDASIEALAIRQRFGKLSVSAYGRMELEPGIVENGRILDKPKLVAAINSLLNVAGPGRMRERNVILSVPESKAFIHIFKIPAAVSRANLGEAVQFAAAEVIPVAFDQTYHDYQQISREGNEQEVLYIAVLKEVVDDLREVAESAGLKPLIFESESLALARALVRDGEFEGVLIVDLGARTTILTVYDHQGVRYSANIGVAGNRFTERLAKSLGIPLEKAEAMKRDIGLRPGDKKDKVWPALEPLAQEIIVAIKKAINYYRRRTNFALNSVILCGGTSLMPGLQPYFENKLKMRVSMGEPLAGLQYNSKTFDASRVVLYSTVVGLARRGVDSQSMANGINLLAHAGEHKKYQASQELPSVQPVPRRQPTSENISPPARSKRLWIFLGIFIFLLLALAAIYFLQRGRQDPLIKIVNTAYTPDTNTNQASSASTSFTATVLFYTKTTDSLPANAIAGRLIEKTITQTDEYKAIGKKSVSRQATGTIKVINKYSAGQSLVATTRFLSPDSVLFRLKQGVTVPAGSSVETEIYADQEDFQGEVKPGKFSIPGLSTSLQQYIYGETSVTITGGTSEVSVVMQSDIDSAQAAAAKNLDTFKASDLQSEVKTGEILLPVILSKKIQSYDFSKKAGDEAAAFTLAIEAKITVMAADAELLKNRIDNTISQIVSTDSDASYQLSDLIYQVQDFNQETGQATLEISGQTH